ncbi:helix-turn-helix transcriptional regulator [Veillonellaceae bacterium WCA-693-APC-5D-A]|uniref:Helix-turn-helix transcriptional regulator n=1 Tax=Anaerovibrio slackiae TaxID=2652309 RepID=A0A6I2UK28_9FIRM|nr:helix-turn-helix transcriptional regulator [Anaerovibrio slackiae]
MKNQKLINARCQRGLTQVELAQRANLTVRGYQNFEHGVQSPNIETAICIANTLGIYDLRKIWDSNLEA